MLGQQKCQFTMFTYAMALTRGKKNLRRPRLYGRTGTYNLHPELNQWLYYFTDQPDCHDWPVGPGRRMGWKYKAIQSRAQYKTEPPQRQNLVSRSSEGHLSGLLSAKSPSGGLESALHEDCLSYQAKLPFLHAPGLPVQPFLFISCCELNCGHCRLCGPAGPGLPMTLLAVV